MFLERRVFAAENDAVSEQHTVIDDGPLRMPVDILRKNVHHAFSQIIQDDLPFKSDDKNLGIGCREGEPRSTRQRVRFVFSRRRVEQVQGSHRALR